jgi:hypothetical protein
LLTNGGNFFFFGGAIGMPAIPRGAAIFIEEGLVRLGGCIIWRVALFQFIALSRFGRFSSPANKDSRRPPTKMTGAHK